MPFGTEKEIFLRTGFCLLGYEYVTFLKHTSIGSLDVRDTFVCHFLSSGQHSLTGLLGQLRHSLIRLLPTSVDRSCCMEVAIWLIAEEKNEKYIRNTTRLEKVILPSATRYDPSTITPISAICISIDEIGEKRLRVSVFFIPAVRTESIQLIKSLHAADQALYELRSLFAKEKFSSFVAMTVR